MSQDFEAVLDRRLNDFEKLVDAKLTGIGTGVEEMRSSMAVFVQQVSNMHKEYKPRTETEKDEARQDKEIEELKKEVDNLKAWRNYLAGAVGIMIFVLGILAQTQFWK